MIHFTFTPIATAHMQRNGYVARDLLGAIPDMISADNPAGAVDQIDRAYADVGGGWQDSRGLELDAERGKLKYPGDPARELIARAKLRDEEVLFFDGAWIVVLQLDGSFRTARID